MCDLPAVSRDTVQASRKPRKCCECGWPIAIGERYQRTWGVWDREARTFVTCLGCARAREEHLAALEARYEAAKAAKARYPRPERPDLCWTFGDLWEEVGEGEDYMAGPEVERFVARATYRSALRERDQWNDKATDAEARGLEGAAKCYREYAVEALTRWADARDVLIAAGVEVPA